MHIAFASPRGIDIQNMLDVPSHLENYFLSPNFCDEYKDLDFSEQRKLGT